MQTKQWTWIDKTAWPRGEWDNEPDKLQWQDNATGLPCLIVRHGSSGHLCGYVGVPEGHPYFGADYEKPDVDVHGGLTFAAKCADDKDHGVCHMADEEAWWLGFDCAHGGDLSGIAYHHLYEAAGLKHLSRFTSKERTCGDPFADVYRNVDYVKRECARLAKQLAKAQ